MVHLEKTSTYADRPGSIFADPMAYADPETWHATAEQIRRESPILRVDAEGYPEFWAITKHSDVLEVERNPEVFTNAPVPILARSADAAVEEAPVKTLVQMDGFEHKAHRAIVNNWFKPGSIKKLQQSVDALAKASIDKMAAMGEHCDFVRDIAVQFPLQVILSILGLPEDDYPRMLQLTQELFGSEDPDIARMGDDPSIMEVLVDFVGYFTNLSEIRRVQPTGDLASVIANADLNGQPLPDTDVLGFYLIIATAGHDTTSNAIAGALLALLDHPSELERLRKHPELIDNAADEFIRYVAPVKHFMRTCRSPYSVRDVEFQVGETLLLSYASANRDEEVFAEPGQLDVRRQNASSHLGFGFGQHFCLGAHLARMEIRALYRELLGRLREVELDGTPTWIRSHFVQGPKSIPIRYRLS